LEEAWIIHALVQDDGMSQVEVAKLLGRHKSWVCRRLALIERLGSQGQGRSTGPVVSDGGAADRAVAGARRVARPPRQRRGGARPA
jgi:hypothetical protein